MKLQTEFGKPSLLKLVVDHIQCGQLFRDEQDLLTIAEAFRNDIGNRLALTRSRRSLQNEALPRLGHLDSLNLAGVRINHVMQLDQRLGNGMGAAATALIFCVDRLIHETKDVLVGKNRIRIVFQIAVHADFGERKNADLAFLSNRPMKVPYKTFHLVEVIGQPFLVIIFRKPTPVFRFHLVGESLIDTDVIFHPADGPLPSSRL